MELKFKKTKKYGWIFESNEIQIKNKTYKFEYKNYYGFANHIKPWLDNGEKANFVLYIYEYSVDVVDGYHSGFDSLDVDGFNFKTKKEMNIFLKYFLKEGEFLITK